MRRVLVIGCPGAGKSTLTRALAETLGLPAVYLDRLWWKSGWINRTRAEFDARLDAALAGDAWVMDGNYLRTLPRRLERCDAVLFLDYPRRLCLFRALRRILRWRGRNRPDMAEGRRWRCRAPPPAHGRGLPGAAGPGVHPLDLGFPPHPAAPGAGASVRLEGRGAYLPQPRPVRRFSCTAEKPKHPWDGMTVPGVSAYARASTSSSSGMRSVRHRSGLAGAPSAYPTARMFTGSRCSGRPRAAFTASGWK